LGDFDALVHSIADVGLLHPIVIDSKNRLLAGYRRLEAYKKLGLTKIEATVVEIDDGDEAEH
jgi:ParB family chromosome partitioning protein